MSDNAYMKNYLKIMEHKSDILRKVNGGKRIKGGQNNGADVVSLLNYMSPLLEDNNKLMVLGGESPTYLKIQKIVTNAYQSIVLDYEIFMKRYDIYKSDILKVSKTNNKLAKIPPEEVLRLSKKILPIINQDSFGNVIKQMAMIFHKKEYILNAIIKKFKIYDALTKACRTMFNIWESIITLTLEVYIMYHAEFHKKNNIKGDIYDIDVLKIIWENNLEKHFLNSSSHMLFFMFPSNEHKNKEYITPLSLKINHPSFTSINKAIVHAQNNFSFNDFNIDKPLGSLLNILEFPLDVFYDAIQILKHNMNNISKKKTSDVDNFVNDLSEQILDIMGELNNINYKIVDVHKVITNKINIVRKTTTFKCTSDKQTQVLMYIYIFIKIFEEVLEPLQNLEYYYVKLAMLINKIIDVSTKFKNYMKTHL